MRDSQGWAHTSPGCTLDCQRRSVLAPSATLPEETEMGKMERKPDDPTKQCGAGPFHTASGSSCSTLLEIRTGEWLLKRHVITGEAWRLKWPQRIWAWVIHSFHEWIPFFGAFIDIYLKKETSIIIWILTRSDYKTIQINCCTFLFLFIFGITMWLFFQCQTEVRVRIRPRLEETRLAYQTQECSINTCLCGRIPLKLS